MKPLKLVLTDHWFEEIKSGHKTHEYRNFTPYWENRLQKFEFSQGYFVQFQKAYRKNPETESILNYLEFTQKMNMAMFILLSLTK